jgi:predicted RNase H-like nuclease
MTAGPSSRVTAVGIDGYPRGWVAAMLTQDCISWSTAPVPGIADLLPDGAVIGIDMPIGLCDDGLRPCDALARQALPGASSRVFTTPPRAVLELGLDAPNAQVQALSVALTGQGVSRQALGLATRILALDAAVEASADRAPGRTVVEVHPELSFTALAGRVLERKKSAAGVGQRVTALLTWRGDIADVLAAAPSDVPVDDALDALAALWSAERWRDGRARTVPERATIRPFIAV